MAKGENSATRREGWRERLFEREILARCKPNGNIRRLTDAFTITMTKKLLFVVTLLCALSFGLMAADITGKWTSEQAGRNGGPARVSTYTFKASGATFPGKMEAAGRGGDMTSTDVTDGKIDGNNISFKISRAMGGGDPVTTEYKGTVDGDTITVKFMQAGRGGADPQERTMTMKRATT